MNWDDLLRSLEYSPVGEWVAVWGFPAVESAHVIALALVVGAIAIMDLRLLGVASKRVSVTDLSRATLPLTWIAFAFAVITGLLLFASNARVYAANWFFWAKMGLLALAGLNMLWFHFVTWRGVAAWDDDPSAIPRAARLAGALSLTFWVLIVFCGRWIGFTLGMAF